MILEKGQHGEWQINLCILIYTKIGHKNDFKTFYQLLFCYTKERIKTYYYYFIHH